MTPTRPAVICKLMESPSTNVAPCPKVTANWDPATLHPKSLPNFWLIASLKALVQLGVRSSVTTTSKVRSNVVKPAVNSAEISVGTEPTTQGVLASEASLLTAGSAQSSDTAKVYAAPVAKPLAIQEVAERFTRPAQPGGVSSTSPDRAWTCHARKEQSFSGLAFQWS